MGTKPANQSDAGEKVGCTFIVIALLVIGGAVYYFVFTPDDEQLASKYNVPKARVYAQPKPHGCAYNDAPLGEKHCHYEKHVIVYAENGLVVEKDGHRSKDCPSCPAWNVEQTWEKIEEVKRNPRLDVESPLLPLPHSILNCGDSMTEERKHAILLATAILTARRLQPLLEADDEAGKPNMATDFWTEVYTKKSMERTAHILDLIDERWPAR